MKKKIYYGIILLFVSLFLASTYTFAANDNSMLHDAANSVRNMVGGAENAIEGAAQNISNTSRSATGAMQNAGNSITNAYEYFIVLGDDNCILMQTCMVFIMVIFY